MLKKSLMTATAVAGCGFFMLTGQPAAPPAVFTAAQAAAGRTAYLSSCVKCHTETLIPLAGAKYMGQEIPPLAGANFMSQWGARTTSELSSRIKVAIGGFPPKDLGEKTYLDLAAYVLQVNGARPGTQELTGATAVVIETTIAAPGSQRDF